MSYRDVEDDERTAALVPAPFARCPRCREWHVARRDARLGAMCGPCGAALAAQVIPVVEAVVVSRPPPVRCLACSRCGRPVSLHHARLGPNPAGADRVAVATCDVCDDAEALAAYCADGDRRRRRAVASLVAAAVLAAWLLVPHRDREELAG